MTDTLDDEDPRCPECGEPVGQTATYCMHCSAEFGEDAEGLDGETGDVANEPWAGSTNDGTADGIGAQPSGTDPARSDGRLLDPEGIVDNSLTTVVGFVGAIVAALVTTFVLGVATGSGWALVVGLFVLLGAAGYLVRRRTVQEAIAKSGYLVALVFLSLPVVAISPLVDIDGGPEDRAALFVVLLIFAAIPAAVAAAVGWVASRFVPGETAGN
jgi:DNA-directed RNA polymerase subunit RPC12/RpoP